MSAVRHRRAVLCCSLLLVGGLTISTPRVVHAANPTIVVTTTTDTVATDGLTSLREAITAANSTSGDDSISLGAASYEISLNCGADEDSNTGGDLDVSDAATLTITGVGATPAEITLASTCTGERLIDLKSNFGFTLENVDLVGGQAPDASGADKDGGSGGAIRADTAPITLIDVSLIDNSAGAAGRGATMVTNAGNGGAISTAGSLTLNNVTAQGNSAGSGYRIGSNDYSSHGGSGGAIYVRGALATVSITDATFYDNAAGFGGGTTAMWGSQAGDGGAVFAAVAIFAMSGSSFLENTAGDAGSSDLANGRDGGRGGAIRIESASVSISNSTFTANTAGNGANAASAPGLGGFGGAISLQGVYGGAVAAISGSNFVSNQGGTSGDSSGTSGTSSNSWGGHGGAIAAVGGDLMLLVSSSNFTSNRAGDAGDYLGVGATVYGGSGGFGGAIAFWGASGVLDGAQFYDNTAGDGGTGSTACFGGGAGTGGAVAISDFALARPIVQVAASIFQGNTSGTGTGCYGTTSGNGGGLWYSVPAPGSLSIDSSLFEGNHADAGNTNDGNGGAISTAGSGPVGITNVTMHANSADGSGGAIATGSGSQAFMTFATITDNVAGTGWPIEASGSTLHIAASVVDTPTDATGTCSPGGITSDGYNVELTSNTCAAFNQATDDTAVAASALGRFGDNGGDRGSTHLPNASGVLVDAVPDDDFICTGTDQRGVPRGVDGPCDIGAVELRSDEPQMFFSVDPVRLVDTRVGQAQGAITVTKKKYGGDVNILRVAVTDYLALDPSEIAAVSLNVTAHQPAGGGYLTVYPCGTRPVVSSVNYVTGQTVPNAVITPVDPTSGDICIYSSQDANIIIDIAGYFAAGVGFEPVDPVRLVDTRVGQAQGAITVTKKKYGGAGNILQVAVTDHLGLDPSDVEAVALNVTAHQPTGGGYLTVYPCGTRPLASSVNYVTGQTVPNAVIAPVDPVTGDVCVYSVADANIIIDIAGYFATSVGFEPVAPTRLVDTRVGQAQGAITVTQKKYGGIGNILQVKVTDVADVPASGVAAVSLNVTAHTPVAGGYFTVYPCGERPTVSSVNYVAGQTVPNAVIAPVDPDTGEICIYSSQDANVIIDVAGWFLQTSIIIPPTPD